MFSGQIYDVLVSGEGARPEFPRIEKEALADRLAVPAAKKDLATFSHLLPRLAAITAKKQGRRNVEKIRLVTDKPADLPLLAQPDFGFKLVGARHGDSDWILPGKLLPDHDEFHSSNFKPEPEWTNLFIPFVPGAIAWALQEPAAWALASNIPWVITHSSRELVVLRFYRINPEERDLPALHEGEVPVGASYFAVPALPPGAAASTAWEHRALFALPWYRNAPPVHRRALSYHLGLWVALMARLWYLHSDPHEGKVHEAHYSTAFKKALIHLGEDRRPYSVINAQRKASESQHNRECEAVAAVMNWRPDSPVESERDEQERPRKKMKCRLIRVGGCAQIFHNDDGPWVTR
ncbi:hypothetical protein INS49_012130 [Diaporthe citri]|uniref:uncharacterized protein n=1 Tax=Diaporthe citri TaxID=83186 RepID=UPI001C7EB144|nr:uncharacterized protein INS49_012130 [Diaporthe citri]KAG6358612.1 hypothetical protein INS49_012130 [Diaporthe citri]